MSTVSERLAGLEVEVGDLVAVHEPADERDYTTYAADPVGFIREVLGETRPGPWEAQVEIAEAVRDQPFVAVRGCNASGKDWLAARLALWWVYARMGLCIVTGPTQKQVRKIVFGEIARAWSPALPGELYQNELRIGRDAGRGIIGVVSNAVSRQTGFHGARVLTVLTEAQGVEPEGWEAMLSCRTGDDDRTLAVANPLFPSGQFFESCRRDHWASIRVSAERHPNVVHARTIIPGGPSRTWIETMANEYGRGSGTYRSRVLAEFPEQGEESLFSRAWLESAALRWEEEQLADEQRRHFATVAVDPARYGPDSTTLAVARGPVLERIASWRGKSTMETVDRIIGELTAEFVYPKDSKFYNPKTRLVVDVVGLGAGVVDRLKEKGYRVDGYNGGQFTSSWGREKYLNERARSHWHLRTLLEDGRIALPRDQRLFDELMAVNWQPTTDGKVQIERKTDLKSRLGRSPDRADAVIMAFSEYDTKRPKVKTFEWRV